MLSVLTPLSKLTRVSRKVDASTFAANPGIWVGVASDGSVANITAATAAPAVVRLVIGYASSNAYESHDVEVGRITTLESTGCRVQVDSDGYDGTPAQGAKLMVSASALTLGKLVEATSGSSAVAYVETIDTTAGLLTFVMQDPQIIA